MSIGLQVDDPVDPAQSFLRWIAQVGNGSGAALMRRMGHGDHEAFSEFYDLTSPRVLAIVSSVIADSALAEELTAEIFLEFWKTAPMHAEEFEPLRSVVLFARYRAHERLAGLAGIGSTPRAARGTSQ